MVRLGLGEVGRGGVHQVLRVGGGLDGRLVRGIGLGHLDFHGGQFLLRIGLVEGSGSRGGIGLDNSGANGLLFPGSKFI